MAKKTNFEVNGNKYFRVTRTIGHKPDGTLIRKFFYGKGINEANEKANEFMQKLKKGVIIDNKQVLTINILFPKWLFSVKRNEIEDSSLESYESTYRNYIKPYLIANQDIANIKSIMIQDFYNELNDKKVTKNNIKKVHKVLNPFFKYAEKEGYVLKNPCSNITLPKDKEENVNELIKKQKLPFDYFRVEEIPILRNAFKDNKYKNVVDFALATGMREGEIVGLEWKNVNLNDKEIYVKDNSTRSAVFDKDGKKQGYKDKKGKPKTKSSVRIVPISQSIYSLLLAIPKTSEYVFTVNDKKIDKKDLQKNWKKTLKKLMLNNNNFTYRKFHDLRHTFAVMLLLNGVDLFTIMKLLGHKKLSSTEIYLAVLPESKHDSINKLNYLFKTNVIKM